MNDISLKHKQEAKSMMLSYASQFEGLDVMESETIEMLLQSKEKIVLVDVREKEEQEVSMIPTAITKNEFLHVKNKLSKDVCIVPYCTIGYRSGVFGKKLQEEKFTNVYNGEGIVLWSHLEHCNLVVGTNREVKTNKVHTYGSQWNKVPSHIEAVYFNVFSIIASSIYKFLGW